VRAKAVEHFLNKRSQFEEDKAGENVAISEAAQSG
jgi:hypothetical protein